MEFKELDFEGEETLKAISQAKQFNKWMYDSIEKHCHGKILEIGSGIGNISEFFIKNNKSITLSDIREQYRSYLRESEITRMVQTIDIDIVKDEFEKAYSDHIGQFDTVFALNVVEHIENDKKAIDNMLKLLKKDGTMIILVPAYQSLYNGFDEELMHYRRYNKESIKKLISNDISSIIEIRFFNFMGIWGWFLVGNIMKKRIIPSTDMRIYNRLVPAFRIVDKLVMKKVGLSVIAVLKKN